MSDEFDVESLLDELTERIEEAVESAVDEQLTDIVQGMLPEALSEALADREFVLPDGTVVRSRRCMKLLAPDKSKLLCCYGGLRVDGQTLVVQTRVSSWEAIAAYPSREEAIAALVRVKDAAEAGQELLEL